MKQRTESTSDGKEYVRASENLYRNTASGLYYALVKRSGKQIRRSLKTTDFALAKRRLKEFIEKSDRLDLSKGKQKVGFQEWGEQWLETMKAKLKPASHVRRLCSLKQLKTHFGTSTVRGVTRTQCEEWASKRAPRVAASTYNNERETLISILDYALREGLILDNPARVLERKRQGKRQLTIPTRDQFLLLVKTMRGMERRIAEAANLIELLAYSGMRKGEANAFRWGDIDWKRGMFAVTGGEGGTKNHDVRMVPIFPALRDFLESRKAQICEHSPDDLVVPGQSAPKAIQAAGLKAELPHFTHHSMRHFFVSNAIEKGIDFKVIAAWVGHKDGGVLVAQTYGHLRNAHSMEMAKLMTV